MLEYKNKIILNKIVLVAGLTFIRMPRIFGLDNHAAIIILTLIPFWFVILENQIPDLRLKSIPGRKYIRILVQLISLIIIIGAVLLVSTLLVETYTHGNSIGFSLFSAMILCVFLLALVYGIAKLRASAVLDGKIIWIGFLYFLVLIVSMLRSSIQSSYDLLFIFQTVTFIVFCLSSMAIFHKSEEDYFRFVYLGLFLYLFTNIGLNIAGVKNFHEPYLREFKSVIFSLIGLEATRIYFPLAEGVNSFGMVAGLGFAMSVGYLAQWITDKTKPLQTYIVPIFGALTSLYVIMQTDSRGALLFSASTSVLILFLAFWRSKYVFLGTFLSQLSVFGIMTANDKNYRILAPLIRENGNLLSGRGIIWQAAQNHLQEFSWIHLVGYGLSGQVKSGLINEYSYLFASYVNKTDIYLHHFGLQSVFDVGYLGLLVGYMFMIALGFKLLQRRKTKAREGLDLPVLASLIFIILAGSVSIIPALYAREIFYLFPFIWVSAGRCE